MSLISTLDTVELAKLMKAVILEIEKKMKNTKPTKSGSMPKGVVKSRLTHGGR
jgi:hypothetical protein